MNELELPFKPDMLLAYRNGAKTQTRRTHGLSKINECPDVWELYSLDNSIATFRSRYIKNSVIMVKARYLVGQVCYVQEQLVKDKSQLVARYAVDGCLVRSGHGFLPWRWQHDTLPSIFMPKEAARDKVQITDVRCHRVQNISEEDARAEGVSPCQFTDGAWQAVPGGCLCHLQPEGDRSYACSYAELWDRINGNTNPWAKNCWVFAYTFEPDGGR